MRIGKLKLFEKRTIGHEDSPLLVRYALFRVPWFGIFLHKLCRSDHERALHDHPWPFFSLVLRSGYTEVTEDNATWRGVGSLGYRPATWKHRVVITNPPTWTLLLVGPRQRRWGFWPNDTWCWWRKYNTDTAICEEDVLWEDRQD